MHRSYFNNAITNNQFPPLLKIPHPLKTYRSICGMLILRFERKSIRCEINEPQTLMGNYCGGLIKHLICSSTINMSKTNLTFHTFEIYI